MGFYFSYTVINNAAQLLISMAPRKKLRQDTSHTFLIPSHVAHLPHPSSSVNPVAVVDKVSADYRRTFPQKHSMRLPTPPPQSFFYDFSSRIDDEYSIIEPDTSTQPVIMDLATDPIAERRKHCTSSVSNVTLFQFITVNL